MVFNTKDVQQIKRKTIAFYLKFMESFSNPNYSIYNVEGDSQKRGLKELSNSKCQCARKH